MLRPSDVRAIAFVMAVMRPRHAFGAKVAYPDVPGDGATQRRASGISIASNGSARIVGSAAKE